MIERNKYRFHFRVLTGALLAVAGLTATEAVLSAPASHFVLSSKDSKFPAHFPDEYVLNADVATLPVPAEPSGAMVVSSLCEHLLGEATMVVRHGR